MQKTLFVGLQQRDALVLDGTLIMLAHGSSSDITYRLWSGNEIDWNRLVMVSNALDESGILGWLMHANGLLEK